MSTRVYTIGHSNHEVDGFVALLRQHAIDVVCDVRSVPCSRRYPWFAKAAIEVALKERGVRYLFLGDALGARPGDPSCFDGDRALHSRIAATELFQAALDRIETGSKKFRIALMCAEREPLECHRSVLVVRNLALRGIECAHILASGELESHAAMEKRMAEREGVAPMPLLDGAQAWEAALEEAYRRASHRLEYVRRPEK
ncbi:MAG: DUF488 domain-containing protein [Planctomycetota bacterium]